MARPLLGWLGTTAAASLIAPLIAAPVAAAPKTAADDEAQRTRVDTIAVPDSSNARNGDAHATLTKTDTRAYRMLAVTWANEPGPSDVHVAVRTHSDSGWSDWRNLEVATDGPGEEPVAGTTPLWVDHADGVAVRVRTGDGTVPDDLEVVTIDPAGTSDETRAAGLPPSAGRPIGKPPKFPNRPPIATREDWNVNPRLGDKCFEPIYGKTTKAAIVHHTAGTNNYSPSDSAAIVRGIHAYHTRGRDWCDIGYNFLVDRFGRIFEGRDGGITRPVRGAHAGDFNTNTMGVSMMGSFESARLPRRLKNAVVRLVGWRLGTNYVHPRGRVRMHGKRIARISGHRDVMSTACPGDRGHRWLPRLRKRTHRYLSRFHSPIRKKARSLGRGRTGPVRVGERRQRGGRRTSFQRGVIYWSPKGGAHYVPRGAMLRGYLKRGGAVGRLGYPVNDFRRTKRKGVYRLNTRRGRLYVGRANNVHALTGAIERAYVRRGGVTGRLGMPRTDTVSTRYGSKARFTNGAIRYNKRTKKITVRTW